MPHIPAPVTGVPPAEPHRAAAYFSSLLQFETDCWDVHQATRREDPGFVLLDVRSPDAYAAGHVPGARNLPHGRIVARTVDELPSDPARGPCGHATPPEGRNGRHMSNVTVLGATGGIGRAISTYLSASIPLSSGWTADATRRTVS